MSEAEGSGILGKYIGIKVLISNVADNLAKIQTSETVSSIANSIKVIPSEPAVSYNNAHIAYTAGWIADVSGGLVTVLNREASRPDLSSADKQEVQKAIEVTKDLNREAKELSKESEDSTTPGHIGGELGNYLLAANYSQIISAEIKEIGKELNDRGDVEKVSQITESIYTKAPELEKPPGDTQSFASNFMNAVKSFKDTLKAKFKKLTGKISGAVKDALTSLLKKAADSLQEFFTRLIAGFFGFVSWVHEVAKKNKFTMTGLNLEFPSLEFNILMVGPYPLPVPKLTTPKLTAKFIPQPESVAPPPPPSTTTRTPGSP